MNDIENQIEEVVESSPAVTQQVAENTITQTQDATTHQYGFGIETQDSPIFQEPAKEEGAGIDMSPSGDPLVVGTAIPKNTYDTKYVPEEEGSPLYFQTGVYDAMPWPELDKVEADALAEQKAIYTAMGANARPDKYIGYIPLPEEADLSWWSHTVGSVENAVSDLLPVTLPKAIGGIANSATKVATGVLSYPLKLAYTAQPDTVVGRWAKAVDEQFDDLNERSNALNDMIDAAVAPIEKVTAARYQADLTDPSLKANIGRSMGPGLVMIGLGIASRRPDLAAAVFNFSQSNALRNQALNAGVSSSWADAYSVGVPFASTLLDNVQILGTMGIMTLTYKASKDVLKDMTASGLVKFGKTVGREAAEMAAEGGIEVVQEAMENVYNPEFLESPVDQLTVAFITAAALRGIGIPASVRHAKLEQQAELAKKAGVLAQYNDLRANAVKIVDELASKGVIDSSKKAEVMEYLISTAPDVLIEHLRLGIKGDLDAIPEQNRAQMIPLLNAIKESYGSEVFSPRMFQIIDNTVDTNIADIRGGLSDAEVQMIKGLVRGGYVVATIAHRNDPNYKGFKVPTFVITNNKAGSSYYSPSRNEIGIHASRSNTENSNLSPQYVDMIRRGFMRSSAMSDKLDSIIHEMGHWLDAEVGSKGFADFFKYYYGAITQVFGKTRSDAVKAAVNGGKSVQKRMPHVGIADYTSEKNATEHVAQALGRMGKRVAEYFGLGRSQSNKFLSYANIMLNQLGNVEGPNGEKLYKDIAAFQDALQDATKRNMADLADLIDVYGSENIKEALRRFNSDGEGFDDFAEYLASKDMLRELYKVMDGFADAAGIQKINDLFDGNDKSMDNFVIAGDYMFKSGYDEAIDEVRKRRLEAKAKRDGKLPADAIVDPNALPTPKGTVVVEPTNGDAKVDASDMPTWFDDEQSERFWPTGKIPFEAKEKISNQSDKVQNATQKIVKKYFLDSDGFILPDKVLESYGINDISDVKDLTGDEFVHILNEINNLDLSETKKILGNYSLNYWGDNLDPNTYDLEETGTQYEVQDWAKAAQSAKDSVKQSAKEGAQEPKPIFANTDVNGRKLSDDISIATQGVSLRAKTPMNSVVKWFASSRWGWGLDRILITVLGRDAAEKFDVAGKYTAKKNIRSKYWEEFMGRLTNMFGDPKTNTTSFMFKYKTMTTDLGMVRLKNVVINNPIDPTLSKPRDITGWEAMYVYLMNRQGFGKRVQQGTQTNINDIIAVLSSEEKSFADSMSAQLMSMFERSFGRHETVFNYFPIQDATHEYFKEVSINSLMERQNTDDTIAIVDAGRVFSQYLSRWASHESGYFQTIKRLRDVFGYRGAGEDERGMRYTYNEEEDKALQVASAQVAHIVREEIGEGGYDNLMNILTNQLSDGQEQMYDATRNSTLNQIGNNIVRSLLAFKPISLPKNMTNLFMMWGGAKDQSLYWNSFAEGIGDMKRTWAYMVEHSPEIKQRWGGSGINEYLDQSTLGGTTAPTMKALSKALSKMDWNSDVTQNMAKFSAAMDMMGDAGLKVFMQFGDMVANVYGGYGLVKDYMAQGFTEEEAFQKLDRYIVERQSSSNLTMKPLVQLEANKSILGQIFAFTSEGVAKAGSILGTFDEVKMGTATKTQAIANAAAIAISMALFTLLGAGAWDLLDEDEEVREETKKALADSLLDQALGGFVAGNALIAPMFSQLVGDTRISGMQVPIYNYITDGIVALKKEEYDKLVAKTLSAMGVFVGADNVWNSMLGASLVNDPNPQVRYAGKLMLSGYSAPRAKKRTGIDVRKETIENSGEE